MNWEYAAVESPDNEAMNAMGSNGWEAFAVIGVGDEVWFKRPLTRPFIDSSARTEVGLAHFQCDRVGPHIGHKWVSYPDKQTAVHVYCEGVPS